MSNKDSRISIVNLSNYVQPEIKEVPSKKYVTYGVKNSYFQYLIDRSRGSATNGSVINSIIDMIYGKGLNDETLSRDQLIEGMIANPKLIERPIVIKEGEARIGRPPENVLEIL